MKSKRAEPGENRNERARGTLGRGKERSSFALPVVPRALPIFHFSCFRLPPPVFFRLPPRKRPLRRREDLPVKSGSRDENDCDLTNPSLAYT